MINCKACRTTFSVPVTESCSNCARRKQVESSALDSAQNGAQPPSKDCVWAIKSIAQEFSTCSPTNIRNLICSTSFPFVFTNANACSSRCMPIPPSVLNPSATCLFFQHTTGIVLRTIKSGNSTLSRSFLSPYEFPTDEEAFCTEGRDAFLSSTQYLYTTCQVLPPSVVVALQHPSRWSRHRSMCTTCSRSSRRQSYPQIEFGTFTAGPFTSRKAVLVRSQ